MKIIIIITWQLCTVPALPLIRDEQVPGRTPGPAPARRAAASGGSRASDDRLRVGRRDHEVHEPASGQRRPDEGLRKAERQPVQGEGRMFHTLIG